MPLCVEGRMVYINTNGTQTVKICTPDNTRGKYEKYYRISTPLALSQTRIKETIRNFTRLDDLEKWLIEDRKAQREPRDEVARNALPMRRLPNRKTKAVIYQLNPKSLCGEKFWRRY